MVHEAEPCGTVAIRADARGDMGPVEAHLPPVAVAQRAVVLRALRAGPTRPRPRCRIPRRDRRGLGDPDRPGQHRRRRPEAAAYTHARLGVAVTRGLLLDLLATGERERVDEACRSSSTTTRHELDQDSCQHSMRIQRRMRDWAALPPLCRSGMIIRVIVIRPPRYPNTTASTAPDHLRPCHRCAVRCAGLRSGFGTDRTQWDIGS